MVADAPSGDEKAIISAVGAAAALYLEDVLLGHERIGISSWSETLLAMVTVLTRRPQPVAETVAQVIGGVGIPEAQVQATRLTEQLAALTGGQPLFLPTPGVVSGKALRDAMLEEPYVAQVVEAWSRLTVLLAGIGSLDPSPLLRRSGNAIAEADQEALRTLGAVGDICLRFFDAGHTSTPALMVASSASTPRLCSPCHGGWVSLAGRGSTPRSAPPCWAAGSTCSSQTSTLPKRCLPDARRP